MFQHAIDWNVSTGAVWTMKPPGAAVKMEPTQVAANGLGDLRSFQHERHFEGRSASDRSERDAGSRRIAGLRKIRPAMRIESAEVLGVGCELTGENTFIRLTTDSGITGLGLSGGWGYPRGVAGVLDELSSLLIGADPFRIEHLWHLSYRARPFRGNLLSAAVSAIDLALWDIKGKALDLPVWELLGGRTRDRVRLHVLVGGGTPDEVVSSVNWAVEEGFTAVKFDPLVKGYEDLSVAQLVGSACDMAAAAREAGGDEIDLIFELHRKLDPANAIVICNALARFNPLFIEDPIQIDSIATQAEIGKHIAAPIAMGERLSSIWEFSELLSHNVPILVRPDVGIAGGLSGCRKIAAIAEAHHCGVAPHNLLGPSSTAPTLHLSLTIPNLVTMEYLPSDEDASSSSAAFETVVVRSGGYCEAPEAPGLGVSLVDGYQKVAPVVQRPFSNEGLLRADGSVAAANWANGSIPAAN
jgi:galactonate dehydratase